MLVKKRKQEKEKKERKKKKTYLPGAQKESHCEQTVATSGCGLTGDEFDLTSVLVEKM